MAQMGTEFLPPDPTTGITVFMPPENNFERILVNCFETQMSEFEFFLYQIQPRFPLWTNMRDSSARLRANQTIWFGLFLLLSPPGSYLLVNSMLHPGQFVDEALLLASLLVAFALSSLLVAIQLQFQLRAVTGHPRRSARVPKKIASH